MQAKSFSRRAVRWIRSVVGQKNFYRAARLLMYEARFDVANDLETNGERYLQSLVKEGIVFDIGANIGDWTSSLLAGGFRGKVHAFEPVPGTFKLLEGRIHDPRVTLVPSAVSDFEGVVRMSSVEGLGINAISEKGDVEVPVTTVDSYCAKNQIARIDLLKIDAEGYDFNVLLGARSLLSKQSISLVQFEYNQCWIETHRLLKDAFELLASFGYSVGKLVGDQVQSYSTYHWELETYREGNYVAYLQSNGLRISPAGWL